MPPLLSARHHPACYPSDPQQALAYFRSQLEKEPEADLPLPLLGLVTPHLDFRVSGSSYARAFRPFLAQPLAETYLILGVGHRSPLEWNLDYRDYLTPLGQVSNRQDWIEELKLDPDGYFDPAAHRGEHSIEFPLLWLQAVAQMQGQPTPHFLPILCGGLHPYLQGDVSWAELHEFHALAAALGDLMQRRKNEIGIIVSIDGCHQGPRFQHRYAVTPEIAQATAVWEDELWKQVTEGSAYTFLEWVRQEGNARYFDGIGALVLLRAMDQEIVLRRTDYGQWIEPEDQSMVTFSSGILYRAAS